MASLVETKKIFANQKLEMWTHDPDGVAAAVVTPDGGITERWVDFKGFEQFAVIAMASLLTGAGITKLEIVAAEDAAGTNLQVIKDSGVLAADAVGDYVMEECTAVEISQIASEQGLSLRYVAGRITMDNAADEAAVTYERNKARFPQNGLSSNTIS